MIYLVSIISKGVSGDGRTETIWICEQNENKSLIKKCMILVLAVLMLQVIYSLGGMKQAPTSILPYILGYFMSFNKITLNSRGGGTALLFLSQAWDCIA